jgi:radical SAM protein with 4Fe4S-binding SPASM domain
MLELSRDEMAVLAAHLRWMKNRFDEASETTRIRIGTPFNVLCLDNLARGVCVAGLFRGTVGPDLRTYPCDAFKHITPEMIGAEGPHPSFREHDLEWCLGKSDYFEKARHLTLGGRTGNTCRECKSLVACRSGCVAQKILGGLQPEAPDPGCLAEHN